MTTIFLDGSALVELGALDQLAHLADAGNDLVLVAPSDHGSRTLLAWAGHRPALPEDPPRGSWYVTADPATCTDRRPGLRTLLVGPRGEGRRPTRCDSRARDLRDAVLEILAADAMG
jgi:hypothetical protein